MIVNAFAEAILVRVQRSESSEYFRFEQYQQPEIFLIVFKAYVGKYRLSIQLLTSVGEPFGLSP